MVYVGIDLGGTSIKAGLVDEQGKILCKATCPTLVERGARPVVDDMAKLSLEVIEKGGYTLDDVKAIGVGLPGIQDPRTGIVPFCTNLYWHEVPVIEWMQETINKPIYIGNDATVAGLAESVAGVSAGIENSVFLTLGTGVGGGIVVEGKLLHGAHGSGAEIGHLVLNRDETVPCNCGKRGCVEQYCSATGIVRLAKRHLDSTDAPSSLRTLKNLTCKDIFDAGKAGDKEARIILDRYYAYMGEFLGDVCTTVDPEVVVIGGGVSKAGQVLIDGILPYFHKYVFHAASGARFTLASLGNDAGAYGAFKLALDAFHA